MTVKERITALRARMKETGIDAYLIPTDDFHGSEYVGEYFKCRKYIPSFIGDGICWTVQGRSNLSIFRKEYTKSQYEASC